MFERILLLAVVAVVSSCTDGGNSDNGGDSTTAGEMEPLEIIGVYDDDVSGIHEIDDDSWVQRFDPDTLTFFISYYDNDLRFVVAQSPNDGLYHKFEWVFVGEQLYYCASAPQQATAVAAEVAPGADGSDPAAGGCLGAPWHPLTPQ